VERFELLGNVRFQQYLNSKCVHVHSRLPLQFPEIHVIFTFVSSPAQKYLPRSSPEASWPSSISHTFQTELDAVEALSKMKDRFWCTIYEKPLFSST
jgi:hypothetical protein